jgi:hypothetical protein
MLAGHARVSHRDYLSLPLLQVGGWPLLTFRDAI